LGGLALVIHWGFIVAFIPGIIFSMRGAKWAKRLIRIYLRTAVVFFGALFYANIKGGGVLSPGYALNFILTTMIFALGIAFFFIMWRDKKIEASSTY
jgi:hypothetical protein